MVEEDVEEDLLIVNRPRSNRRNKTNRRGLSALPRPEPTFRALGIRGKSHNKHRRYQNCELV